MLCGRTALSARRVGPGDCRRSRLAQALTDEEVTAAVRDVIAARSTDGVFPFTDARTGERLDLVLDDVRLVRGLPVYGWFPNVVFHDKAEPAKKYALDFWLKPNGDRLELMHVRIHKVPKRGRRIVDEHHARAAAMVVAADDGARQRRGRHAGLAGHGSNPPAHRRVETRRRRDAADRLGAPRRHSSAGGKVKGRRQVLCLCRISQVRN